MNEPNKYFGRDEYSNSVVVEGKNLVGKIVEIKIKKLIIRLYLEKNKC